VANGLGIVVAVYVGGVEEKDDEIDRFVVQIR
jgi:hypothetical protein